MLVLTQCFVNISIQRLTTWDETAPYRLPPLKSSIAKTIGTKSHSIEYFTCGQSYKHFTIVNFDSRVIPDLKIPNITTLES